MTFEKFFDPGWISIEENTNTINVRQYKELDTLEQELAEIKDSLLLIEEKQRRLANLSKLYS